MFGSMMVIERDKDGTHVVGGVSSGGEGTSTGRSLIDGTGVSDHLIFGELLVGHGLEVDAAHAGIEHFGVTFV
jgi:hypothetical protein